ncbi:MAG: hypothetical protein R2873_34320 [Caldilineaceae bacterium]
MGNTTRKTCSPKVIATIAVLQVAKGTVNSRIATYSRALPRRRLRITDLKRAVSLSSTLTRDLYGDIEENIRGKMHLYQAHPD